MMFITTANYVIDPILRFLKKCLSKKSETHLQQYNKKCKKLTNDSCFKAKMSLIKPNTGNL